MNTNDLEKNYSKGKVVLLLTMIIVSFVFVVGGISYAFFGVQNAYTYNSSSENVNYAAKSNMLMPTNENKYLSIARTMPQVNISMDAIKIGNASATTPINTTTYYLNVTMNGAAADICTYNIILVNSSLAYGYIRSADCPSQNGIYCTNDEAFEYSASFSIGNKNNGSSSITYRNQDGFSEVQIDRLFMTGSSNTEYNLYDDVHQGAILAANQTIQPISGKVATKYYRLITKIYNLPNINQDFLYNDSTIQKTAYRYQMKIVDLNCDWRH